jgi:hypothetical protein
VRQLLLMRAINPGEGCESNAVCRCLFLDDGAHAPDGMYGSLTAKKKRTLYV